MQDLCLSIIILTSLEGSAIEMKPTAPVSVDTVVSLKAYLAKSRHNFLTEHFIENTFLIFLAKATNLW